MFVELGVDNDEQRLTVESELEFRIVQGPGDVFRPRDVIEVGDLNFYYVTLICSTLSRGAVDHGEPGGDRYPGL